MSVQDGLDEMMGWMEGVEASVKDREQIPLDSASIGDILSKEVVCAVSSFKPSYNQILLSIIRCCLGLICVFCSLHIHRV